MGTPESVREPCPDRILDDIGLGFSIGAFGGSAFHFIRGIYNSPAGARLSGGTQFVGMHAPKFGGRFAVWGGLFSTFDCALVYARQKEDPWNSILAGAATQSLMLVRKGFCASGRAALVGGAFIALIEGVNIVGNKFESARQNDHVFMGDAALIPYGVPMGQISGQSMPKTSSASVAKTGLGSWFRGLFGNGKKKESEDKSGSKTQILESFDAPHVPTYERNKN